MTQPIVLAWPRPAMHYTETSALLVLAMIFGFAPALTVATGLLSPAWIQLGALSSSLAAIVLVMIEGRKGGLRELLSRALIWRVGVRWWLFAVF